MKDDKRLKRKVRNSYIVSNISIALVLFLLGYVLLRGIPHITWELLSTAPSVLADRVEKSLFFKLPTKRASPSPSSSATERTKNKKNRSANGSKPTSW